MPHTETDSRTQAENRGQAENPSQVWKEFDQNVITHSAAHHLMAIDDLLARQGYARVSDVARQLGITRGSVSISLRSLRKDGLVVQDENRHVRLSERGGKLVEQIKAKRHLMKRLLAEVLGVDPEQAEIDACKMEHLLSGASAQHMIAFLRFIDSRADEARRFLAALRQFDPICVGRSEACPSCENTCLNEALSP